MHLNKCDMHCLPAFWVFRSVLLGGWWVVGNGLLAVSGGWVLGSGWWVVDGVVGGDGW